MGRNNEHVHRTLWQKLARPRNTARAGRGPSMPNGRHSLPTTRNRRKSLPPPNADLGAPKDWHRGLGVPTSAGSEPRKELRHLGKREPPPPPAGRGDNQLALARGPGGLASANAKWVSANGWQFFPAVSRACPGGCRPTEPPDVSPAGLPPPRTRPKAPPARAGSAFWGGPGGR
eukprot:15470504-Alexandrium_andersonii.AAC.1